MSSNTCTCPNCDTVLERFGRVRCWKCLQVFSPEPEPSKQDHKEEDNTPPKPIGEALSW